MSQEIRWRRPDKKCLEYLHKMQAEEQGRCACQRSMAYILKKILTEYIKMKHIEREQIKEFIKTDTSFTEND